MMWSWLAFVVGLVSSFAISFLAMIGWWYLTVGRQKFPQDVQDDFDLVREAIKRAARRS